MELVIDEREAALYSRILELAPSFTFSKRVMTLGDAMILDPQGNELCIIERKSLADLLSSITDGRYKEQAYRLTHSSGLPPHHIIYCIEGVLSTLKSEQKKRVYGAITSTLFFKGFSVYRTSSVHETADWLCHMMKKLATEYARPTPAVFRHARAPASTAAAENTTEGVPEEDRLQEPQEPALPSNTPVIPECVEEPVVSQEQEQESPPPPTAEDYCHVVKRARKDNLSKDNMGHAMLVQIPGVSGNLAKALMEGYSSWAAFYTHLQQNPGYLDTFKVTTSTGKQQRLSKTVATKLREYLL